jgi:hypothetical protein
LTGQISADGPDLSFPAGVKSFNALWPRIQFGAGEIYNKWNCASKRFRAKISFQFGKPQDAIRLRVFNSGKCGRLAPEVSHAYFDEQKFWHAFLRKRMLRFK